MKAYGLYPDLFMEEIPGKVIKAILGELAHGPDKLHYRRAKERPLPTKHGCEELVQLY